MTAIERINAAAGYLVPEIILLATMCIMFLVGPFFVTEDGKGLSGLRHRWGTLSLLAIGCALLAWSGMPVRPDDLGPFQMDAFVGFVRGVSLCLGIILVLLLWNQTDDAHAAEAHACLLAMLAGVNIAAAANDLIVLFLGLELVSIPTYVLIFLPRRDRAMREATLKYFLLSIFSAALFLYGMAWLFGAAGTTNMQGIIQAASAGRLQSSAGLILLAQVLLLAGIGFRVTAVPFHFYAPDVFQGSSNAVAGILSFIPKLVGFVALLRLLPLTQGLATWEFWVPAPALQGLLTALAILTMFVGNLMAMRQSNLQRLMAYSSVAHAGYMLTGVAVGETVGSAGGSSALLFYLAVYGLMTLGVFAVLFAARSPDHALVNDSDLAGLGRTRPLLAAFLAVFLFSLTGLPPTAGMLGKLFLFLAAWNSQSPQGQVLAIVLALNAAIAAAYYLRLVGIMYMEKPHTAPSETPSTSFAAGIASAGCVILVVGIFLVPQGLWDAAFRATH